MFKELFILFKAMIRCFKKKKKKKWKESFYIISHIVQKYILTLSYYL